MEQYLVEVVVKKKILVEVDSEKFNDETVADLLLVDPGIKTVKEHLGQVALMHCAGRTAGNFGHYGLVKVDGNKGIKLGSRFYKDSGLNLVNLGEGTPKVNVVGGLPAVFKID